MFNYYICLYNNVCERNGNIICLNINRVNKYTRTLDFRLFFMTYVT